MVVNSSNQIRSAIEIRDGDRGEDQAGVFRCSSRIVLAVADGAGGTGSGAFAANALMEEAQALANQDRESPAAALMESEQAMYCLGGQAAGIILEIANHTIRGASVGDSECWWLVDGGFVDLTAGQARKPLLGDGATPVAFGPFPAVGRLLLATDGLFNYADIDHIIEIASGSDIEEAARRLADLPRLPNGEWPDDLGLILIDMESS